MSLDWKSLCTGVALGAGVVGVLSWQKSKLDDQQILQQILNKDASQKKKKTVEVDQSVRAEQFVRNRQFFGDAGQDKVHASSVVVIGLGGVGSHCAVALARSGVERIRIIDFDRVTVSSLNRHVCATWDDVGKSKVHVLKRYIESFNPHCQVEAIEDLFSAAKVGEHLAGDIDFVVDCIDNLPTKIDLLAHCYKNDIRVIVACGAGSKADPTRLHISDIAHTAEDELARKVRERLKKEHGIVEGIPVVYSSERTNRALLPFKDFQEEDPTQYQTMTQFRVRIIPVIAPMPALMGNAIASYVLCELAGQPFNAQETAAMAPRVHRRALKYIMQQFKIISETLTLKLVPFEMCQDLYCNVYHGKSPISGQSGGLQFVPWLFDKPLVEYQMSEADPSVPQPVLAITNLALMTGNEALKHAKDGGTPEKNLALWGEEKCATMLAALQKASKYA